MPEARLSARLDRVELRGRRVLDGVELDCAAGSHTAILGPNGAGKTTLLRALVGLVPFTGWVHLDGSDATQLSSRERARRLAYVPQRSLLESRLAVRDVVMQGRYAHQDGFGRASHADRRAVEHALELTDTRALAERNFPELSGGERRRVLLARALATEAPSVLLDEPTASLDLSHQLAFFERLRELSRAGRTIVTVLHDLRDAARYCDHAVVLAAGRRVYAGSAQLPDPLVQTVFGVRPVPGAAVGYELAEPGGSA